MALRLQSKIGGAGSLIWSVMRSAIANMKRCTYCGKEYPDDTSVCLVDGQPVEDGACLSHTKTQQSKRFFRWRHLHTSKSPQRLKHSVGAPFWIGCLVGPVLFMISLAALGVLQDGFAFRLFAGVAVLVFAPVGGMVFQAVRDVFVAGRLRLLRVWDFVALTAIVVALVVAGEALFHALGRQSDIDMFRNRTFDIAGVFILLLVLVYAISRNLGHLLSRQTWGAIFLTAGLLGVCSVIYWLTGFDPSWIMVPGTALWAAIDSSRIHLKDYESSISYGPVVVFVGCVLVWFIAFPWYLIVRHRIKTGTAVHKDDAVNVAA